ncbi:hypothetical protein SAMN05216266_12192 [Amycolatopsis marina]|uniref:Ketohydroxyglutarate aldolase n=1 Tax=Amycolatopsis marina TaxID=490629 RepID=A0A1I1C743_9PSEU|nr:hypothetical protein [Amycolatopsis marina]SFB57962.1 hypothetical protein SAMN05216266_12192 [Amycolatopsis marina]
MAEDDHRVIVSIADDNLDRIGAVVATLRSAGLRVQDVQDVIGTVTGWVHDDALGSLKDVPGVVDVEFDRGYQLPPGDGPQ